MKIRLLTLCSLISITGLLSGCLNDKSQLLSNPPHTVQSIDLSRYIGQWYEIGSKPMRYQAQCASDISARYSANTDGTIRVDNRCITFKGNVSEAIGKAKVDDASKAKLLVSFFGPFYSPYWIFWVKGDKNGLYEMALVGSPDRRYLWLLARTNDPDPLAIEEALKYAQSLGFNLNDFKRSPHTQTHPNEP